jgi:site-specific DNA recombinase
MKNKDKNQTSLRNRALLYLRVSTEKQAEKGIAIETQKVKCLEFINEQKLIINFETDIYIDAGESGRTKDRPALLLLLDRCKNDSTVKSVVIYDISRLARNRIDFAVIKQDFNKYGVNLLSATEPIGDTPEGQILEGILSSVSEYFSAHYALKIRANMLQKTKDGWWANKAPYGYKNVQEKLPSGGKKAWIEIDWIEAKWVTRAFELFATGNYSMSLLADKLVEEGFPLRLGKMKGKNNKLHTSFIEKMLRNKFYVGTLEWGGLVINDGKHELFLSKELFEKTQSILDYRLSGGSRNKRLFSILKSISFCDECGSKMTSDEQTTSSGNVVRYLRCLKAQHGKKVECSQKYTHESEYLTQFQALLEKIELPQRIADKVRVRIREIFADEQELYEFSRKSLLGKIEDIKTQKTNLVKRLISKETNSTSDIAMFEEIKLGLESKEAELQQDLVQVENRISATIRLVEIAISLVVSCSYAFKKAPNDQVRALLARTLFKSLKMHDGKIVDAKLNEPLDYILIKNLKKASELLSPIQFEQTSVCDPGRNRTCIITSAKLRPIH